MSDNLGQFFTPYIIVKKMLNIRKYKGRVLEPSSGNGAFLSMLENTAVGVEMDKNLVYDKRVIINDFFNYSVKNKFETIIGNPPYVRFQDIVPSTKLLLDSNLFDKRSNLYLFFIDKCMRHLVKNGELIFITPRDFLKATSSSKLNDMLYKTGYMTHYYELGDKKIFKDSSPNCAIWRWVKGASMPRMETGGKFTCKNGQILFREHYDATLGDYFDIKVGAVSGANDLFVNKKLGNVNMVCSKTWMKKETIRVIYNIKHKILVKHKDRLIKRKVRLFNDGNWWEWGRKYYERDGLRIYVNMKTRNKKPFYSSFVKAYDGSMLALFPKQNKNVDIEDALQQLNNMDWAKLGFCCDGRLLFSQRSLLSVPIKLI